MKKLLLFMTGAFFSFCLLPNGVFATSHYHLIAKIPISGEGGWDLLTIDPSSRRLYVSHGTQVEVVDMDSDKVVGQIPNLSGVHGIAIAPDLGRGFISNGKSSMVTLFDLKTLKTLSEVKAGTNPDTVIYDPATHHVFVFNGKSANATVLDGAKGGVVATLELEGKPEFAVSDEKGHVFVNLEDKNAVLRLDSKKLKIEKRWPLAPCEEPAGLAMDQKNRRLFIGCGNHLTAVVDADNGQVIQTLPIGDHVDATTFDPELKLIFNSNGDGTLTVIHQDSKDKYSLIENVKTQVGARTMALDPTTHKLYLPTADLGPRPESTPDQPHPRPKIIPDTFRVLVLGQ